MFGWAMQEEAKLEFTITVNWRREDGGIASTQLGTLDRSACRSAEGCEAAIFAKTLGDPGQAVMSAARIFAVLAAQAGLAGSSWVAYPTKIFSGMCPSSLESPSPAKVVGLE